MFDGINADHGDQSLVKERYEYVAKGRVNSSTFSGGSTFASKIYEYRQIEILDPEDIMDKELQRANEAEYSLYLARQCRIAAESGFVAAEARIAVEDGYVPTYSLFDSRLTVQLQINCISELVRTCFTIACTSCYEPGGRRKLI